MCHAIGITKLFTPGFDGYNGIYVPVYSREAVYAFNIAPTTKPVITDWYVGSVSELSSPPQLAGVSVGKPQLSGINETVRTMANKTYNSIL